MRVMWLEAWAGHSDTDEEGPPPKGTHHALDLPSINPSSLTAPELSCPIHHVPSFPSSLSPALISSAPTCNAQLKGGTKECFNGVSRVNISELESRT